mmetsp:Transcript_45205/g.144826  ORF Transcript_45205/g.144826 Transcript_45205/m.144826 type:complete len:231 (-) Transcript_45205:401-1093(-)
MLPPTTSARGVWPESQVERRLRHRAATAFLRNRPSRAAGTSRLSIAALPGGIALGRHCGKALRRLALGRALQNIAISSAARTACGVGVFGGAVRFARGREHGPGHPPRSRQQLVARGHAAPPDPERAVQHWARCQAIAERPEMFGCADSDVELVRIQHLGLRKAPNNFLPHRIGAGPVRPHEHNLGKALAFDRRCCDPSEHGLARLRPARSSGVLHPVRPQCSRNNTGWP